MSKKILDMHIHTVSNNPFTSARQKAEVLLSALNECLDFNDYYISEQDTDSETLRTFWIQRMEKIRDILEKGTK